ncbi:MAG: PEP-CTERM sorting domain-containing protein [Roseibacillus sp.]
MKILIILFVLASAVEGVTIFRDRVLVGGGLFGDLGTLGLTVQHSSNGDEGYDSTTFRMANPFSEIPTLFGPDDPFPVSSRTSLSAVEDGWTIGLGIDWVQPSSGALLTKDNFFDHPVVLRTDFFPATINKINLLGRDSLTLGFLTAGGDVSFGSPGGIGWVTFDVEPSMGDAALSGPLQLSYVDSAWIPANYGIFAGTLVVVPEPSGLILTGVGLIVAAYRRNRS